MKRYLVFLVLIEITVAKVPDAVERVGSPILLVEAETYYMDPLWSPDGSRIAFTGANYKGIYLYEFQNTEVKAITDKLSAGFGMSWSWDGQYIAARISKFEDKRRYSAVALYSILDGKETLLSGYETRMPGTPRWTANNHAVYLSGSSQFRSFDLPDRYNVNTMLDEVVIYVKNNRLFSRNVLSKRETQINSQDGDIVDLDISSDGQRIAYKIYGGDLWISDIDGNNLVNLGVGYEPSWNPISDKITFMIPEDNGHDILGSDIYVVNADGTGRINLTATPDRIEMHPDWSPDGKWIVYDTYEDGQIWMQEVRWRNTDD